MNEIVKKLSELNGITAEAYGQEVERLIRVRYSLRDELAILRQRDEKPDEWAAYNAYAEECKAAAREKFGISEKSE